MSRMNKRQMLLAAAALIIGLLAVAQWGVAPLASHYQGLDREIAQNRQRLESLLELRQEYEKTRSMARDQGEAQARAEDFSLFSFLDNLAQEQGIKDRIAFMRPSTEEVSEGLERETVSLRLQDVDTSELIPWIYHLENADVPIRVEELTISSRADDGQNLQVDLRVSVLLG